MKVNKYFYNYFGNKDFRQRLTDGVVEEKIAKKWIKMKDFKFFIELYKLRTKFIKH